MKENMQLASNMQTELTHFELLSDDSREEMDREIAENKDKPFDWLYIFMDRETIIPVGASLVLQRNYAEATAILMELMISCPYQIDLGVLRIAKTKTIEPFWEANKEYIEYIKAKSKGLDN
jgi:hypothetical protein